MAHIIDGKSIALSIRQELKKEVAQLYEERQVVPGLAVILVGAKERGMPEIQGFNSLQAFARISLCTYAIIFTIQSGTLKGVYCYWKITDFMDGH